MTIADLAAELARPRRLAKADASGHEHGKDGRFVSSSGAEYGIDRTGSTIGLARHDLTDVGGNHAGHVIVNFLNGGAALRHESYNARGTHIGNQKAIVGPLHSHQKDAVRASLLAAYEKVAAKHEAKPKKEAAMTIGDLLKSQGLDARPDPDGAALEYFSALDALEQRHAELMAEFARVKARHLANMTDQQRAALEIMGRPLREEMQKNESAQIEIKRRLAAHAVARDRSKIAKSAISTSHELAKMREHAKAIESGKIVVEPEVRRRLASAILKAEMIEAEALR